MWFTCKKEILQEGINIASRAASNKTTYPILEGILIRAIDGKVILTATDLDFGIETNIDAQVTEPGTIVINSKLFQDLIRKLPNEDITLRVSDRNVNISCKNSEFNIVGTSPEDFPSLPLINENTMYELSEDILKNMIKQTIFAVAQDETRPIFTGILFEVKESMLSFVALDGYRLSIKKERLDGASDINAVIPGKALSEISKILDIKGEKVKITFTPNHILFNLEGTKVISRLLEGDFINYRQIIPDEYSLKVNVDRGELLHSIERASLLSREGKTNLIRFDIKDNSIIITSNSQLGNVCEKVDVETQGDDIKIAFNAKYFLDALRIIEADNIILELSTSVSPCIVKKCDNEDEDFIYLVLPVRDASIK
ncbi:DNA polymerase III subunit beta [Clostridium cylindrosporum]|uniref:Beta sliding clamp n=1 Tax=Clostridium cylindrosporum DSM 605 TaxID=1121307 RepID=A0A0J8D6M9_CLOCY|nr:DNA polymerase III subunit beta [Clostridium cylindrosporum]KMT21740.1 DNA polymerase III subunit beta [Clostridium cylindrosporum DSM 605]